MSAVQTVLTGKLRRVTAAKRQVAERLRLGSGEYLELVRREAELRAALAKLGK